MRAAVAPDRVEELKQALLSFLARLSEVARGARGKLRVLLVLSLLSACWLSVFVRWLFDLSLLGVLPATLALAVPALFIWRLQGTLRAVIALPEQLSALGDDVGKALMEIQGEARERIAAFRSGARRRIGFGELLAMGRQLAGMGQLLAVLRVRLADGGRSEVVEAVVTVASPAFVILMAIATVGTFVLALLAAASGIAYLVLA